MSSDGDKLVRAATVGDDAKVKRLLKARADVNSSMTGDRGATGITVLQNASHHGQVGAVTTTATRARRRRARATPRHSRAG